MLELSGKKALVTGAATRVGRSIALGLARHGVDVALHYHQSIDQAQDTKAAIRALGVACVTLQADLSSEPECKALVARCIEAFGGLDLLVSSAANFERIAFTDVDERAWDAALDLNARATLCLAQASAAALKASSGSIVCITCSSNTIPMRGYLPYQASKAALKQIMRVLSLELAPEVRVNAVAPGTVLPPEHYDEATLARIKGRIPLGRFGKPEDIADAVIYLARAEFVTGQELCVDGGRSVAGFERFG